MKMKEIPKFRSTWYTNDVVGVAKGIASSGSFNTMSILGDTLKDAGCEEDYFLKHCNPKRKRSHPWWLLATILGLDTDIPLIFNWGKVYKLLGMKKEFDEFIKLNPIPFSKNRVWYLPIIKGLRPEKVFAVMEEQKAMPKLTYSSKIRLTKNDRDPRFGSYIVGFTANMEADEKNKGWSSEERWEQNYKDITLLERLFLDLAYFLETENNLDKKSETLCSGSIEYLGRYIPSVTSDRLSISYIGWHSQHECSENLRPRSVVFHQLAVA